MKTKVAAIGLGHLGKHHARIYSQLPEAQLVCVVDTCQERAREIGEKLQVPHFTHIQELPNNIEAASIATPTSSHYEVAKPLLEKGIHLLIEKPITSNSSQAQELVEIAQKNNCKLQVGHIERFNPAWQKAKKYIQNPYYIEAQRTSPYRFRSTDISVVHDIMIHDLDILLHLIPAPLDSLEATGQSLLSPLPDIAHVRLRFENNCIASLKASRLSLQPRRTMEIYQNNGYLHIDFMHKTLSQITLAPSFCPKNIQQIPPNPPQNLEERLFQDFLHHTQWKDTNHQEPLKTEIQAFLHSIQQNLPVEVSGKDGLYALEIAEKILHQLQNPKNQPLPNNHIPTPPHQT
ncbi:MAG: gfo/Idh/MocA family oxidoreductase [Planctomycetota bacterium]|nr:MAG: gfo/Idh/MocA family oxidoreductase [Planctomycetota bacterium]